VLLGLLFVGLFDWVCGFGLFECVVVVVGGVCG
jgi:hypothetical protein